MLNVDVFCKQHRMSTLLVKLSTLLVKLSTWLVTGVNFLHVFVNSINRPLAGLRGLLLWGGEGRKRKKEGDGR